MDRIDAVADELATVQQRLLATLANPVRTWSPSWERSAASVPRAVLLHGPRGVGKTQFMLRALRRMGGFYWSMDHPLLASYSVYEWVTRAFGRGADHVFLDEIHHAPDWSIHAKALYDAFPGKTIWLSGSSSILMSRGLGDLSRRFLAIAVPYLSFREYLELVTGEQLDPIDPFTDDAMDTGAALASRINVLGYFETYLREGVRPVGLNDWATYSQRMLQTVQKTLEGDIPYIVSPLGTNHYRLMNAVLGYLATAPVPTVQVNSLCREWNVGKEKLYTLLHAMEQTGLLRIIRKRSDHAAMSVGAKMFLSDPSLYHALSGMEGNSREAYVACACESAGRTIHAESEERRGDFIVDNSLTIEVGGPRKGRKNADWAVRDRIDTPSPGVVPLWMLGVMW